MTGGGTRTHHELDPVCAIVRELESAIIRAGWEVLDAESSSDTIHLDTCIRDSVHPVIARSRSEEIRGGFGKEYVSTVVRGKRQQ
jgi:hypothetical protein